MAGRKSNEEVEIKLCVDDAASARRLLRRAGFRVRRRRTAEFNLLYDSPEGSLRLQQKLLRVRRFGPDTILTYKGPARAGRHKIREELELGITDGPVFGEVLARLGLAPSFRYEKYRTVFSRPGAKGVVTLDETPIGDYLELEGQPAWIDRTAAELGFAESDYITASYARLYFERIGREPHAPAAMLFGRSGSRTIGRRP